MSCFRSHRHGRSRGRETCCGVAGRSGVAGDVDGACRSGIRPAHYVRRRGEAGTTPWSYAAISTQKHALERHQRPGDCWPCAVAGAGRFSDHALIVGQTRQNRSTTGCRACYRANQEGWPGHGTHLPEGQICLLKGVCLLLRCIRRRQVIQAEPYTGAKFS